MSIDKESTKFITKSAKETEGLGFSLAHSLYHPCSKFLLLKGELGTGKTTFIQGIGTGFGFGTHEIQSPTYAVERDYQGRLLHLDLFRIPCGKEASPRGRGVWGGRGEASRGDEELLAILERANEYEGFVAVEWSEKLPEKALPEGRIEVKVEEQDPLPLRKRGEKTRGGSSVQGTPTPALPLFPQGSPGTRGGNTDRLITLTFLDSPLPNNEEIKKWEEEMLVLPNIKEHEHAVTELAVKFGEILLKRNVVVRLKALEAAARLHDTFRFLNFPEGSWEKYPKERQKRWKELAKRYSGRHENACAEFLKERGYDVVAAIVATHGVRDEPVTTEQKLLHYADKRMAETRVVSLEERFIDFARRYGESPEQGKWIKQAKEIEAELFPEGSPT